MSVFHLVLITDSIALDPHAQELAAAAIPNLRDAVLAPAVAAEGVPAVHRGCLAGRHVTKTALTLYRVCLPCRQQVLIQLSFSISRMTKAAETDAQSVCADVESSRGTPVCLPGLLGTMRKLAQPSS